MIARDDGQDAELTSPPAVESLVQGRSACKGGFSVLVTFRLKPGVEDQFMRLVLDNAQASLDQEPDCLLFDVFTPTEAGNLVVLYEVYSTKGAFDFHLATPHFAGFAESVAELVAEKTVLMGPRLGTGAV